MFDTPVMLTPMHYAYLIGVIAILAVMVRRRYPGGLHRLSVYTGSHRPGLCGRGHHDRI